MTKNSASFFRKIELGREILCSLLFPTRCIVCDEILSPEEKKKGIHKRCESKLYPITGPVCMQCGRPIKRDHNISTQKDIYLDFYNSYEYCMECKSLANSAICFPGKNHINIVSKTISHVKQGKALYVYKGDIKQTMYRFKYSNKREYAKFFAMQAAARYGAWMKEKGIQVIVPVPMYAAKERRRGYNQALCFAKELSALTGIPVETRLVYRVKDTMPLKRLNRTERQNNLKNAFQKGKSIVQYSHILVVDDIYTTGSTAQAVAEVLIQKGTSHVYFMSICIGETM